MPSPEELKDIVAEAVSKLIADKAAVDAVAAPQAENPFEDYESAVAAYNKVVKPLVLVVIEDDEEFAALAKRTEDLAQWGDVMAILIEKAIIHAEKYALAG